MYPISSVVIPTPVKLQALNGRTGERIQVNQAGRELQQRIREREGIAETAPARSSINPAPQNQIQQAFFTHSYVNQYLQFLLDSGRQMNAQRDPGSAEVFFKTGLELTGNYRNESHALFHYEITLLRYSEKKWSDVVTNATCAISCLPQDSPLKAQLIMLVSKALFARKSVTRSSCDLCMGIKILDTAAKTTGYDSATRRVLISNRLAACRAYDGHVHT